MIFPDQPCISFSPRSRPSVAEEHSSFGLFDVVVVRLRILLLRPFVPWLRVSGHLQLQSLLIVFVFGDFPHFRGNCDRRVLKACQLVPSSFFGLDIHHLLLRSLCRPSELSQLFRALLVVYVTLGQLHSLHLRHCDYALCELLD